MAPYINSDFNRQVDDGFVDYVASPEYRLLKAE